MNEQSQSNERQEPEESKPGLFHLIASVLAGAIGVQSNKNRERDFQAGDFKKFVIGGLVFTILFILTLVTIVNIVLGS